jgi:hypothetical protein
MRAAALESNGDTQAPGRHVARGSLIDIHPRLFAKVTL